METKSLLKKCFVIIILLLGIMGVANLNAQDFTVGDLNYRINDDGVSVTVTGHVNGYDATGELIIPESVNYNGIDYSVTIIGDYAFDNCLGLIGNLVFPNSVTQIGARAFGFCAGFTGALVIGNNITSIGALAFWYCSGFTSLDISSTVTLLEYEDPLTFDVYCDFEGCSGLEEITVESGNPIYDSRDNCNAIIKTNTNELVFGCKNTTIPNSVNTIIGRAFKYCSGLNSISIPSSVTSIGTNPFSYCGGLQTIIVEEGNAVYDSRNNCNAIIKTDNNALITGCMNTIIPDNITSIDESAFAGCIGLNGSLMIPNSVINIGHYAYAGCENITGSLTIPNSVTYIGVQAFAWCFGLDGTLTIGNSVEYIGAFAFENCSGFTSVVTLATTPPELYEDEWEGCTSFYGLSCTTLSVPCGCVPAYENSLWHEQFTTILEDCSDVEELDENLASVYPNPTNGLIKIEAENIQNVSVYNMLGEMVLDSEASGDTFEYDFSNNESGVYLVRIETAIGIVTKRITVM